MRRIVVVIAAFVAVLLAGAALMPQQDGAEAHHKRAKAEQKSGEGSSSKLRPGCSRHYRMKRFYRYTKARYTKRSKPLTKGQKLHIKHLALCLATKEKSHWAYAKKRKLRAKFRARLARARQVAAYHRLTPYVCANGTRWAIPCSIIACESGYSWSAYNPSGARGPYQFLGWNVPWPVRTWADKMAHHRMGAALYNGGAGRSHWVC